MTFFPLQPPPSPACSTAWLFSRWSKTSGPAQDTSAKKRSSQSTGIYVCMHMYVCMCAQVQSCRMVVATTLLTLLVKDILNLTPLFLWTHTQYYSSIAEAVQLADPGERIVVHPGVYNEHITLNKSVSLIGVGELLWQHPCVFCTVWSVYGWWQSKGFCGSQNSSVHLKHCLLVQGLIHVVPLLSYLFQSTQTSQDDIAL